jgi:hypothetical protein
MSLATRHTIPAQSTTAPMARSWLATGSRRPRLKGIGVVGPILVAATALTAAALVWMPASQHPSVPTAPETTTMLPPAAVADRVYEGPAVSSSDADQTETRTYELTITGSGCSLLPVDSVPPARPPNHIYGSGQDIVELYAQLCPGAAH